ncbi:MAG: hypothetical protein IJ955_05570, partial [Oscillospiraceae bacterium]|nr:hypothetical protein [Oscillospiraceae bacterium]
RVEMIFLYDIGRAETGHAVKDCTKEAELMVGEVVDYGHETRLMDGNVSVAQPSHIHTCSPADMLIPLEGLDVVLSVIYVCIYSFFCHIHIKT